MPFSRGLASWLPRGSANRRDSVLAGNAICGRVARAGRSQQRENGSTSVETTNHASVGGLNGQKALVRISSPAPPGHHEVGVGIHLLGSAFELEVGVRRGVLGVPRVADIKK